MDFILTDDTLGLALEVSEYFDLEALIETWSGNKALLRDSLRLIQHCELEQLPSEAKDEIERFIEAEFPDTCAGCGCNIPLEERVAARDNGGLCGCCAHRLERLREE